jgi:hypothetical protein
VIVNMALTSCGPSTTSRLRLRRPEFVDCHAERGRDAARDRQRGDAFAALDRAPIGLGHAGAIGRLNLPQAQVAACAPHWGVNKFCRHIAMIAIYRLASSPNCEIFQWIC